MSGDAHQPGSHPPPTDARRSASAASPVAEGVAVSPVAARPGNRRTWTALLSILILLSAPFVWMATMADPFLRSTALAAWLVIALGTALGLRAAMVDRRPWVLGIAGGNVVLALLGVYAFFELSRTPPSTAPDVGREAPAFVVVDERDRPVDLKQVLTGGPALLVFYRGFW